MAEHHPTARRTGCDRAVDIQLLTRREHFGASESGDDHRVDQADGQHRFREPGAEARNDRHRHHDCRHGRHCFHGSHHDPVDPTPEVPDGESERNPDDQRDRHRLCTSQQRIPSAEHQAAREVASDMIGTQPIFARRLEEDVLKARRKHFVVWREERGEHRDQDDDDEIDGARHRQLVLQQPRLHALARRHRHVSHAPSG